MIDGIEQMMRQLPPAYGKDAGVACIIGFVFGGLGLAIYLRNVVDLVFPVAITLFVSAFLGVQLGWLAGAIVASLYGYFRVTVSAGVSS